MDKMIREEERELRGKNKELLSLNHKLLKEIENMQEEKARLKKELEEKIAKILISLAYQKVGNKLVRVDIDHRKFLARLRDYLLNDEVFKEK